MAYVWRGATGSWRAAWPYAVAVVLALLALAEMVSRPVPEGPTTPLVLLVALGATLPVALVRAQPVAAVALAAAALAFGALAGVPPPVAGLAALLVCAGYLLLRLGRRARAHAVRRDAEDRELRASLLDHVARGERARIARELHDVVAHHISMIAVQSDAARLTTPGMPAEGARRLVAIGETARTALTEMRRLLGVLREDAGTEVTRRPQPGLQQLNELLDEARELTAGSTRLIVSGTVVPLDPGVELVAYRIVQEALTNVRRHAPGAAVDVELRFGPDTLRLSVRDNGPGAESTHPADASSGHGLTGMRERVATVGGRLTAGPAPTGGFLVEAVLPTTGPEE
jgi:signal transduction histidine kinase